MAPVTYSCPIDPVCEPAAGPGFCPRHPTTRLQRARAVVAPPPEPACEEAAAGAPEAAPAAADAESAARAEEAGPRPTLCLRLLGQTVAIPGEGLVIGRDAPQFAGLPGMADLLQVSRRHARLNYHEDGLLVLDLGSVNGTFVRGRRIQAPEFIGPGEPLRLGQDVVVEIDRIRLDAFGLPG